MKKVIIGALVAAVVINGALVAILYHKKLIFQPKAPSVVVNQIPAPTPINDIAVLGQFKDISGIVLLQTNQKVSRASEGQKVDVWQTISVDTNSLVRLALKNGSLVQIPADSVLQTRPGPEFVLTRGLVDVQAGTEVIVMGGPGIMSLTAKNATFKLVVTGTQTAVSVSLGQVVVLDTAKNTTTLSAGQNKTF